jgi:hypothetical protein
MMKREAAELNCYSVEVLKNFYKGTRPVPPPVIWERKLQDIRTLAVAALEYREQSLPGQRSWAEIPFGGDTSVKDLTDDRRALLPWDPTTPVVIPDTMVAIGGSIDRLDLDGAGTIARVTDYKSGKPPGKKQPVLKGGAELQRCLYAYLPCQHSASKTSSQNSWWTSPTTS